VYAEEYKLKVEAMEKQAAGLKKILLESKSDVDERTKEMASLKSRIATLERENKSLRMFGVNFHHSPHMEAQFREIASPEKEVKKESTGIDQNVLREMMVKTRRTRVACNLPLPDFKQIQRKYKNKVAKKRAPSTRIFQILKIGKNYL
jgi:hypothetical protein